MINTLAIFMYKLVLLMELVSLYVN